MFKTLKRNVHQSWLVVFLCVGLIIGTILGIIFRINYFFSWWWRVLAVLFLTLSYFKPKYALIMVAFLAGMILAFTRVADELKKLSRDELATRRILNFIEELN